MIRDRICDQSDAENDMPIDTEDVPAPTYNHKLEGFIAPSQHVYQSSNLPKANTVMGKVFLLN